MEATRRNLQAQPKIYRKERKCSQKNYASYLQRLKEPKIRLGATRRNLQAQPKILKKYCRNIKSTNQN
jgi:hypothetical protein